MQSEPNAQLHSAGAIGYFAKMAAEAGCIGQVMLSSGGNMPPTFGTAHPHHCSSPSGGGSSSEFSEPCSESASLKTSATACVVGLAHRRCGPAWDEPNGVGDAGWGRDAVHARYGHHTGPPHPLDLQLPSSEQPCLCACKWHEQHASICHSSFCGRAFPSEHHHDEYQSTEWT